MLAVELLRVIVWSKCNVIISVLMNVSAFKRID
jgi:hypothetical protein